MYHFHLHSLNRIYNSLIAYPQRRKANGTKDWRLRPYHHSHHVHSFQCDLLVFCIFYVKNYLHVKLRTYGFGCWINRVEKTKICSHLLISLVKKPIWRNFRLTIVRVKFRNFHTKINNAQFKFNPDATTIPQIRNKSLHCSKFKSPA